MMTEVAGRILAATPDRPAVALLVDGESIGAEHAESLLVIARRHGRLTAARVYGDMTRLARWEGAAGFRPIHVPGGEAAGDLMLAIDALDLAHRGGVAAFVIATGGGNAAHLAHHLRERHLTVIGAGHAGAPEAFRAACSGFIDIAGTVAAPARARMVQRSETERDLCAKVRGILAAEGIDGEMPLEMLAERMNALHGVAAHGLPGRSWPAFLARFPDLFRFDPTASGPRVCLR
jgi:hypothetical protein